MEEDLPKNFTTRMQKKALIKTFVSYGKHNAVKQELEQTKQQLADSKRKVETLERELKRKKPRATPNPKLTAQRAEKDNDDTNTPLDKSKHPFGRARTDHCQECKDDGLGNRKHNGPCDPELRKKSAARKRKKDADKKRNGRENAAQHRKWAFILYDADCCTHCMADDVEPKYCTHHNPDTCVRRPGGELDKAGIKGKRKRNEEAIRLIGEKTRRRKYSDKASNAKANAKKDNKSQSGTSYSANKDKSNSNANVTHAREVHHHHDDDPRWCQGEGLVKPYIRSDAEPTHRRRNRHPITQYCPANQRHAESYSQAQV